MCLGCLDRNADIYNSSSIYQTALTDKPNNSIGFDRADGLLSNSLVFMPILTAEASGNATIQNEPNINNSENDDAISVINGVGTIGDTAASPQPSRTGLDHDSDDSDFYLPAEDDYIWPAINISNLGLDALWGDLRNESINVNDGMPHVSSQMPPVFYDSYNPRANDMNTATAPTSQTSDTPSHTYKPSENAIYTILDAIISDFEDNDLLSLMSLSVSPMEPEVLPIDSFIA